MRLLASAAALFFVTFLSSTTLLAADATSKAATPVMDQATKQTLEKLLLNIQKQQDALEIAIGKNMDQMAIYESNIKLKGAIGDLNKAIYLFDDRKNYFDLNDNEKKAARSTLALINENLIVDNGNGASRIIDAGAKRLCTPKQLHEINAKDGTSYLDEPFFDEPLSAFCTGVKLGDDIVATAGHCIKDDKDCRGTRLVFNYFKKSADDKPGANVANDDIYACKSIIARKQDQSDWALIRVDRVLANVNTAKLNAAKAVKKDDAVTLVGYPMGLPVKVAGNGNVTAIGSVFFVTTVDSYGGNSGSPVFNSERLQKGELLVEGLLVRGEVDFERTVPCLVSKRCSADGCVGEKVTYSTEFVGNVPQR